MLGLIITELLNPLSCTQIVLWIGAKWEANFYLIQVDAFHNHFAITTAKLVFFTIVFLHNSITSVLYSINVDVDLSISNSYHNMITFYKLRSNLRKHYSWWIWCPTSIILWVNLVRIGGWTFSYEHSSGSSFLSTFWNRLTSPARYRPKDLWLIKLTISSSAVTVIIIALLMARVQDRDV